MNFERCKTGLGSDRRGVSEVVGNLLILMITVVLFSSIVAYVNQIPVPETTTKADFAASVVFETNETTTASLTVTHAGGVVLDATMTAVFIEAGESTYYTKLSEDLDFEYARWSTGVDWTRDFEVASESTAIAVTVIDLDKDRAIWSSQVSGGMGGTPPIILQRYLDEQIDSPTADPVKQDAEGFSFFVKVIDLDNDLDSSTSGVWIDSSELPEEGAAMDTYEAATPDGWFRFDFGPIVEDVAEVDGKIIKIHASDLAGHTTVSSFVVTVTVLPTDIDYYQINEEFEGGLPAYITWMNDGQGFGMYAENRTTGLADINNATVAFDKDVDEYVFIRVASLRLTNIYGMNSLVMTDMRTGITYVPAYNNASTAAAPFYPYTSSGGAFIYESTFAIEGLPPSAYSIAITLKSSGATTSVFQTVKGMTLSETGSQIDFVPEMWVFADKHYSIPWGSKTTPFNLLNPDTSKLYVKVLVQDAQVTPPAPLPLVDDVRIVDMRGDTQLHGTPPSGSMMTGWVANNTDSETPVYQFEVDLRLNNGDQWIGGLNAYTLKISRFSDLNEGVYSLSTMVYVQTSTARADFFVGSAGYMTGTSNFVNPQYLYYIQNNNFFTKRTLYDYSNAPSAADNYAVSALALGDLDGDGDKDILMGQYGSFNLYYLENSMNTFGAWQEATEITRPDAIDESNILSIACGDTNGDGDIDFAYCTDEQTIVIYNNSYGATGSIWKDDYTGAISKIELEDVTGDGRADLIVLADGRIMIYDMIEWDPANPIAQIPDATSSTAIKDFDIADVNQDGFLDIATTDISTSSGDFKGARVWFYDVASESPERKYLDADVQPSPDFGRVLTDISNSIGMTQTEGGDAMQVGENPSTEPDPGVLKLDMPTQTLTTSPFQQLKVIAKVSGDGGTPLEGFNIWYSVDGDKFTPLIYIPPSQTTLATYTAALPMTAAGATLEIRVTDSLDTSGPVDEILHIDYLAILTDAFAGYVDELVLDTSSNIQEHDCIRVGNIDGTDDGYLEVILARDPASRVGTTDDDGEWVVYKRADVNDWNVLAGWSQTSFVFYPRGGEQIYLHSSMSSDENHIEAILTTASPRLFQVEDVNGDGYSDIIVVNTTVAAGVTSQVALYLNMQQCEDEDCQWWYYVVKDIAGDYTISDVRGGMTYLLVDNLIAT